LAAVLLLGFQLCLLNFTTPIGSLFLTPVMRMRLFVVVAARAAEEHLRPSSNSQLYLIGKRFRIFETFLAFDQAKFKQSIYQHSERWRSAIRIRFVLIDSWLNTNRILVVDSLVHSRLGFSKPPLRGDKDNYKVFRKLLTFAIAEHAYNRNLLALEWRKCRKQNSLLFGGQMALRPSNLQVLNPEAINEAASLGYNQQSQEYDSRNFGRIVDLSGGLQGIPTGEGHDDLMGLVIAWLASIVLTMRLTRWFLRRK
jgi:hypothetical protein